MGKSSARPETIARIHETAKRLGYTPNPTARALVQGKRGAIAILIPEFYGQPSSGLDSKLLITIAKDLNIRNERLMLQFYWTIDDLKDALKASNPASVDGIIAVLTPSSGNPPLSEILSTVKIPIVTINTQPVADTIPNVGLDQISVGYWQPNTCWIAAARLPCLSPAPITKRKCGSQASKPLCKRPVFRFLPRIIGISNSIGKKS